MFVKVLAVAAVLLLSSSGAETITPEMPTGFQLQLSAAGNVPTR